MYQHVSKILELLETISIEKVFGRVKESTMSRPTLKLSLLETKGLC